MNPVILQQHATEHVRDLITEADDARSGPRHQLHPGRRRGVHGRAGRGMGLRSGPHRVLGPEAGPLPRVAPHHLASWHTAPYRPSRLLECTELPDPAAHALAFLTLVIHPDNGGYACGPAWQLDHAA